MRSKTTTWLALIALAFGGLAVDSAQAAEAIADAKERQTPSNSKNAEANESDEQEKATKKKKVRLAHITIEGELPETPGQMSFFGDLGTDLRKTVARIDKAAEDKRIAGLVLKIEPVALPRGKLNELREAIARFRASGKKAYAQLEAAQGSQFLLASACDEIVMPEAGVILLPGLYAEMTYYKDLLDKIGIEADLMHVGAFKGAAEPLTRRNMSEPVRENLTKLIDDLFDQMIATVAADRQLKIDDVRAVVDRGLLTADSAHEAALIDRVAYPDQFRTSLEEEYEADELVYVVNYGKKKVDSDFSGPMGMIKLFQAIIGSGSSGRRTKGPQIAIVYAVGPIMSGESESDAFGGTVMGSETIVEALHEAADDDDVAAIVLRINSPGGSALASDMMWRATQAIEKPIVASMGDVAASGGYYIAMGADRIVAEPGTITGSIGVVGGKLAMKGLYEKIGITTDVISRGKNSGIFSATTKFTEAEREVFSEFMHDIYKKFTTKAALGRDIPLDQLEKLAGGQVYTGRDAKRNGLVDELGTLRDAIRAAKQLAGLDPNEKAGLKILPEPENPFESLFGADFDAEREARLISGVSQLLPELAIPLRRANQLRRILREPAALVMPFWIEIK